MLSTECQSTDVLNPTWLKHENAFNNELCRST